MQTKTKTSKKPVVLMAMGQQDRNHHPYQVMTHKYMSPIVDIADCVPLLIPTCFGVDDIDQYLDMVDGVYLSGAGTNIDPSLYGQENMTPEKVQDKNRDLVDFAIIKAALERKLPLLGICRGMQEINVVLGGDLYQTVYKQPHLQDHREDSDDSVAEQYGPNHEIEIVNNTWLHKLLGDRIMVNSLHGQGICTLAEQLEPLAVADDGLIEAFHGPQFEQFILGVQWHPEWQALENPDSVSIFRAFGDACRTFTSER